MKTALVISSNVAASHVGAMVSAFCLRRLGVDAIVLPTTEFGRHPGWGPPGGGRVDPERLRDIWAAIKDNNVKIDAVLTGYMAHAKHIDLACDIIADVKSNNRQALIWVDPIMGDNGRLYVSEEIAMGVKEKLLPHSDMATPNLWEFEFIYGTRCQNATDVRCLLDSLDKDIVVTSVPFDGGVGAVLRADDNIYQISHPMFGHVPHGGGDVLAAAFLAYNLGGDSLDFAFNKAVSAVFDILKTANENDNRELPLIQCQRKLVDVNLLPLQRLS